MTKFAPSITVPVVSRLGNDETFVELSCRRLGEETVELIATKVEYSPFCGKDLRTEIGREIVSEEDAGSVACDLEWAAADFLSEITDGYCDPCGFEEAVERELTATAKADRDEYMACAIAHNAALIAAE